MLITTQLFDRVVGLVGQTPIDSGRKGAVLPVGCRRATERRAVTRIAFGHRTLICCDRGKKAGVWDTAMMQDISLKGVGLLCHEWIEVGHTFVMKLADRDGQMIRIRCAVQRCDRGGIGGVAFLLGATFEQVIEHKPLQLNEDDGDQKAWTDAQPDADAATICDSTHARSTRAMVGRAAFSFLKALDPIAWMRKADDYSSID